MAALKIVLATSYPADPEQPRGGVEAVSVVLAHALAAHADLEVHVVTADPACSSPAISTVDGVTIHRLPWLARRILIGARGRDGRRVRGYIVDHVRPDVIHAHDTYGVMLTGVSIPRLLTIHGFIHADTLVAGQRWRRVRARVWQSVEHATWADFPRIISISPYVRERLTGIATGVIHDIDNPIAEHFFNSSREEESTRIFSAASVCKRKNTLGLIEAFALLTKRRVNATLRIAGPEPEPAYSAAVRARILQLGISEQVTLLPSLSAKDVARELAAASVAALVSLEENAPLMIAEAMAMGVPVVTSNRCGMPYMVADGETGFLVDPCDPADIADRLETLMRDATLRRVFGDSARAIARARFHPAVVAARTRSVYERAARDARHLTA